MGRIIRPTKDLDVVALLDNQEMISATPLPKPLLEAIERVAGAFRLPSDWINSAPANLCHSGLPQGFFERLIPLSFGSLTLYCAGRFDQICFKLYAAIDQGPHSKHFQDLIQLRPSHEELKSAAAWCQTQDSSEIFMQSLKEAMRELTK